MLAAAQELQHTSGAANGKGAIKGNRPNGEAGPAKIGPEAAAAQKRHARRPHPRAAGERLAGGSVELSSTAIADPLIVSKRKAG